MMINNHMGTSLLTAKLKATTNYMQLWHVTLCVSCYEHAQVGMETIISFVLGGKTWQPYLVPQGPRAIS